MLELQCPCSCLLLLLLLLLPLLTPSTPQSLHTSTVALVLAVWFFTSKTFAIFVKFPPAVMIALTGTVTRTISPTAQDTLAPKLQVISGLVALVAQAAGTAAIQSMPR
jgi:hypothetical protein